MGNADLITRYFDAVNHENWDALASVFHPDATFQTPGTAPRVGRDEIVGLFLRLFDAWTEHMDTPVRVIREGDTASVEIEFSGMSTAGRTVSFQAVDLFTFKDDQVISLRSFYDLHEVRQELAVEAPGARA